MIEVSQLTCTNKACQEEFDKNRAEELARIDERKSKKEEADKIRKDNIARTITARQKAKAALEAKTKKKK